MGRKQEIATGIALQTQVLKNCPIHNQLYCNDEQCSEDDNGNIARAFSIAIKLVRQHAPCAEVFHHSAHELTDLLSHTIGAAPARCPDCVSRAPDWNEAARENAVSGRSSAAYVSR